MAPIDTQTDEHSTKKLTEFRLKHIEDAVDELREISVDLRIAVERLNVKAGFWGALGGAVTVAIPMAWMLVKR